MAIDKKINRIGKTYCNDSPVMAPQSVILLVTVLYVNSFLCVCLCEASSLSNVRQDFIGI